MKSSLVRRPSGFLLKNLCWAAVASSRDILKNKRLFLYIFTNTGDLALLHCDLNLTFAVVAGLNLIVLIIQRSPDGILFTFKVYLPFWSLAHHFFPHFTFRVSQEMWTVNCCTLSFKTLLFLFYYFKVSSLLLDQILLPWSTEVKYTSYSDQTC